MIKTGAFSLGAIYGLKSTILNNHLAADKRIQSSKVLSVPQEIYDFRAISSEIVNIDAESKALKDYEKTKEKLYVQMKDSGTELDQSRIF